MDSNLFVILFNEESTAALMYEELESLEKEDKIVIEDAVIASRAPFGERTQLPGEQTGTFTEATPQPGTDALGETHVKITQTHSETRKRVAAGGGAGLLVGVLLGGPIGGLVAGATIGAISEHMRDKGIDEENVQAIADHLQPGTSALFLLSHDANQEEVLKHVTHYQGKLLNTSIPEEQAAALREALAKEE